MAKVKKKNNGERVDKSLSLIRPAVGLAVVFPLGKKVISLYVAKKERKT